MKKYLDKAAFLILFAYLLIKSCFGFQKIAWGTGTWWGEYSLKWWMFFVAYCAFCLALFVFVLFLAWRKEQLQAIFGRMAAFREQIGPARRLPSILIFVAPIWFLQYTSWGLVFNDVYIRILIWLLAALLLTFFVAKGNSLFGWTEFLTIVLLTSGSFVAAAPFNNVTDYPFSIGWSEGNRMWDYSIMFGRNLYTYPVDKPIPVLLDAGRQFVGGLPFIFPNVTIKAERFWLALTVILPYLLLGILTFRSFRTNLKVWALAGLWVFIFLKQGPIHPPLVFCATAVALLWKSPLWLAIPLIAVTGYAAEMSRFTWVFAPGMWIGMLELSSAVLQNNKLTRISWNRAILLSIAGAAGGYFGPKIVSLLAGNTAPVTAISADSVAASISSQPLLWYRLLPNATYGVGILVGLLVAALPLIVVLAGLMFTKKWNLSFWQVLSVIAPLLAFLVVGLIVSTKIGGGGDLHNMDMFLIGLMFAAVVAFQNGGREWLANLEPSSLWIKLILLLLFALPGLQSLQDLRPQVYAEDAAWLVTLTDAPNERALDIYPSQAASDLALETIRDETTLAQAGGGEVLFLDQRQLLTFGYIQDIPLVAEYEKKRLMDEALASDSEYFKPFYTDIAAHRFALIVSEPLRTPVKDDSFQFGEENNAWVAWVSNPILCYYEPKLTLVEVGVQLLVPKQNPTGCEKYLQ